MTRARYSVSISRGSRVPGRPAVVIDTASGKIVEAHRTGAAAQVAADKLNGRCLRCRALGATLPGGTHAPRCPLAKFERDPDFGTETDDDESEA